MKRTALVACLLLAACSGSPAARFLNLQLHDGFEVKEYVIFAFPAGDVLVELDGKNAATAHVLELVQQGYYDGAFIYNTNPGHMVQFGEAYWQGREPSPRWLVPSIPRPVTDLAADSVAIPVLARPTSQTLIVGPQLILNDNFKVINREVGGDMLRIGKVVKGRDSLRAARKGDKIISAVAGQVAK